MPTDPIRISWRPTVTGGETRPGEGTAYDRDAAIGCVRHAPSHAINTETYPPWAWSLTVSVAGRHTIPHAWHGACWTKDEAKAAVEEAYRTLLSALPDARNEWRAHAARVRWRTEIFARRDATKG